MIRMIKLIMGMIIMMMPMTMMMFIFMMRMEGNAERTKASKNGEIKTV